MLNPISHSSDPAGANRYKVEPYVISADIYSMEPHGGRGGWTWYTGSAGWMYRLIVETLFGLDVENDRLHLNPCLPEAWDSFKLHYRYRETCYHLVVSRLDKDSSGEERLVLDGKKISGKTIPLLDDHREHHVELRVR